MSNIGVSRFTKGMSNLFIVIGSIGMLLMTAIVGWQVFGRYVLNESPDWSEQTALILMIWYVSFAAAAGVQEGFHIRIVAFENAMPEKIAKITRLIAHLVVGLCGLAMLIWGAQLVMGTWSHVVPTLGISRGAVYIAIPISGFLIGLFSVEKITVELSQKNAQPKEVS